MFSDVMTEVVEHECLICQEKVLQTVSKLLPHMARHLTSLEHYHNKYILGIEGEIGWLRKVSEFLLVC
jgi:hypothetical protein